MTYILAKRISEGEIRFVRRILQGGRLIDTERFSDLQSFDSRPFGRQFRTLEKAQAAAAHIAATGNYDDYLPMPVDAHLSETGLPKYRQAAPIPV